MAAADRLTIEIEGKGGHAARPHISVDTVLVGAQIVNQAQGDAQRFISVYNAYAKAPEVTARRIYIDTIQTILKNSNKIILDRAASSSGVLPYLPLPDLRSGQSPAPPRQPSVPPQPSPGATR